MLPLCSIDCRVYQGPDMFGFCVAKCLWVVQHLVQALSTHVECIRLLIRRDLLTDGQASLQVAGSSIPDRGSLPSWDSHCKRTSYLKCNQTPAADAISTWTLRTETLLTLLLSCCCCCFVPEWWQSRLLE